MSDLVYVLTPDSKVVFQIQNWINGQDKNWERGETSDNSWKRKSNIAWLKPNKRIDELIWTAIRKSNKNWNFQLSYLDGLQYTEYNEGDNYNWHQDSFVGKHNNGQRKISMTMFLNDDFEGGEFYYEEGSPLVNPREHIVPAVTGNMVFFPSTTWHKVNPVIKGQRRSLVTWVWGNVW